MSRVIYECHVSHRAECSTLLGLWNSSYSSITVLHLATFRNTLLPGLESVVTRTYTLMAMLPILPVCGC